MEGNLHTLALIEGNFEKSLNIFGPQQIFSSQKHLLIFVIKFIQNIWIISPRMIGDYPLGEGIILGESIGIENGLKKCLKFLKGKNH